MKRFLQILLFAVTVSACSADLYDLYDLEKIGEVIIDGGEYTAIVTVKQSPQNEVYFQLNDSTTMFPRNYLQSFTRMERAICAIKAWVMPSGVYNYTCDVGWIESIEEGNISSHALSAADPIDILDDWMTSVEDGYLTVHYDVWWGSEPVAHNFSIVTGMNPEDPYELLLVHSANGDAMDRKADGLVCFDINSLPSTEGQYKILTLKWDNLGGSASEKKFKFKTRE